MIEEPSPTARLEAIYNDRLALDTERCCIWDGGLEQLTPHNPAHSIRESRRPGISNSHLQGSSRVFKTVVKPLISSSEKSRRQLAIVWPVYAHQGSLDHSILPPTAPWLLFTIRALEGFHQSV
jgi:hypothetical protein